jgi:alpha-ketoglutarate-dependent taurine dioxygenase
MSLPRQNPHPASPFHLANEDAYRNWRARKLDRYPRAADALIVPVADSREISPAESAQLLAVLRKTNMAIYRSALGDTEDKDIPRRLGVQFGLVRLDPNMLADDDGITSLQVVEGKSGRGYIPYSERRLLWHTDGYYNTPEHWIRGMILHCVRPAAVGGENALLDHEIAYLLMRDREPALVEALMAPDAMTIPANTESGEETRAAQTGPVFSVDSGPGNLHMRYTARTRSIVWKDDSRTREAVALLEETMESDSEYIFRHRLSHGEGLICNNVLHNRTAFENGPANTGRLVYRARYYDRIRGTDWNLQ